MKMPAEQVERIAALGYTEAEARFLYIVATHSGYFTLRQFLAFAQAHRGKRSTAFAQKLLKHAHATVRDYLGRGLVFHLFSRLVYRPMEMDNLRNRRRHSFDHISTRLVLLDFLLENSEFDFFETEQDKVHFFCDSLGVPREALPVKVYESRLKTPPAVRFFVDSFPLFLAPPISGGPPVVTFTYVDHRCVGLRNFVTHLGAYQALFRQLKSFRFLYVAPKTAQFEGAETRFRNCIKGPFESDVSCDMRRYFDVRRKWERHEYVVPVTEDLEFLRQARLRFHGERFETLYQNWCADKLPEPRLEVEFQQLTPAPKVFFETYLVRNGRAPLDEKCRTR